MFKILIDATYLHAMQLYESTDYAEIFMQLLTHTVCCKGHLMDGTKWEIFQACEWSKQVEKGKRESNSVGGGEGGGRWQRNGNSPM